MASPKPGEVGMQPEDVPDALIEKALKASHDAHPDVELREDYPTWTALFYDPLEQDILRQGVRVEIAAVWDDIYRAGENNGYADGYQKAMSDHDW